MLVYFRVPEARVVERRRKMVGGCNSNVVRDGRTYHVQTEDKGGDAGRFETLIFLDGAILASRSQPYRQSAGDPNGREQLRRMMVEHHREMIRQVERGDFVTQTGG